MAFVTFGVRCKRIKESWSGLVGTDESGQQVTKGGYGMSNIQGFPGERWESAKRRDSGSFNLRWAKIVTMVVTCGGPEWTGNQRHEQLNQNLGSGIHVVV
jgi:hypothetical protein